MYAGSRITSSHILDDVPMETRTIEVDGRTYKKMKKEWENRPYSIEEMMFYDDLFDGD